MIIVVPTRAQQLGLILLLAVLILYVLWRT